MTICEASYAEDELLREQAGFRYTWYGIDGTCDSEEDDDEAPDYNPSDDGDEFNDILEGDQDAADENVK